MARFKVSNVFEIFGRGTVLTGEIVDGEIGPGNTIELPHGNNQLFLKIKSIEFVDRPHKSELGLMIGEIGEDVKKALIKLIGQTLTIK